MKLRKIWANWTVNVGALSLTGLFFFSCFKRKTFPRIPIKHDVHVKEKWSAAAHLWMQMSVTAVVSGSAQLPHHVPGHPILTVQGSSFQNQSSWAFCIRTWQLWPQKKCKAARNPACLLSVSFLLILLMPCLIKRTAWGFAYQEQASDAMWWEENGFRVRQKWGTMFTVILLGG